MIEHPILLNVNWEGVNRLTDFDGMVADLLARQGGAHQRRRERRNNRLGERYGGSKGAGRAGGNGEDGGGEGDGKAGRGGGGNGVGDGGWGVDGDVNTGVRQSCDSSCDHPLTELTWPTTLRSGIPNAPNSPSSPPVHSPPHTRGASLTSPVLRGHVSGRAHHPGRRLARSRSELTAFMPEGALERSPALHEASDEEVLMALAEQARAASRLRPEPPDGIASQHATAEPPPD
eukprot:scaffold14934_cov58-Isochrysis_galbana.AAC.1